MVLNSADRGPSRLLRRATIPGLQPTTSHHILTAGVCFSVVLLLAVFAGYWYWPDDRDYRLLVPVLCNLGIAVWVWRQSGRVTASR